MSKYELIYYQIIERSKSRITPKTIEKHHIIPRCLGGSNDATNIALLTPREHFVCHLLLTKMFTGEHRKKMIFAFIMMRNGARRKNQSERYVPSSRLYQFLKQESKDLLSSRIVSEETRRKISEKAKLRPSSFKGKKHSDESKKKLSAAKKGRTQHPNTRLAFDKYRAENKAQHLHNPENYAKIKEARRKTSPMVGNFIIKLRDGTIEHTNDLFVWAENRGVSSSTVRHLMNSGLTAKQGPLRGVSITRN